MSWVSFISWLMGFYSLYYLFNILWDMQRSRHPAGGDHPPELHFESPVQPQKVGAEPETRKQPDKPPMKGEPPVSAAGGVNLKDLFNLAKAEVIVYNRAVSF